MDLILFAKSIVGEHAAAQDVVQDSLVAAWRNFSDFERNRDFGAWVRGMIRFKAVDWFRKRGREPVGELETSRLETELRNWQSARAAGIGTLEVLEICLEKLPDKLGAAVHRFYFHEETSEEAARILGISATTLRKRIERARGLLRQCLDRGGRNVKPAPKHIEA